MSYPTRERQHHTRLGWWVMTHDCGGSALIGGVAALLLTADLAYVGIRWRGVHDRFDRGFVFGFVVMIAAGLITRPLGLGKPIGPDRRKARNRVWFTTALAVVLIVLLSRDSTGVLFGVVAVVSGFFVVLSGWWIARRPGIRHGA